MKVKRLRRTIAHQERPPASGMALPPSLASRACASASLRPANAAVAGAAAGSLVATAVTAIVSPELRRHGQFHPSVGEYTCWEKAQFRYFASESGVVLRRQSMWQLLCRWEERLLQHRGNL